MNWIPPIAFAALALSGLEAVSAQLNVVPVRPVAGEPFVTYVTADARTPLNGYRYLQGTFSVTGADIVVRADIGAPFGIRSGPACDFCTGYSNSYRTLRAVTVGTPGTYAISTSIRDGLGDFQERIATLAVEPPRPAATPQFTSLSGNFFASDENGAGVNLIQNASGQLFAVWATYGYSLFAFPASSGYPESTWYVMSEGKWISPTEFQGVMYSTLGTRFSSPWDPAKSVTVPMGVMNLKFVDRNQVDMDAQFAHGPRKQKRLSRLLF